MDIDSVHASIEHEKSELRARYPAITDCNTVLVRWDENGAKRYSLRIDLRCPQHQTLLSGAQSDSPQAAIAAAFRAARQRLQEAAWACR